MLQEIISAIINFFKQFGQPLLDAFVDFMKFIGYWEAYSELSDPEFGSAT